ncbi:class I SAM-dependent methyltransferase [Streptomyces sp. ICBB 8177]|uniref:class I SAM-dependent methyltransferase n=1 Tax=Streptomyces sp. ICBB 8177 TaxID=563922 RepID=UPI001F541425|nr:class I SAM-dependent methyltransferase [Streptomyces sp. ICBB 8177]
MGEYLARIGGELAYKPLDRALLAAVVEQAVADAPVADLGCGPGHVAGWLAEHGVRAVVGIDLSPAMVATARRAHPACEFREGDLLELPAREGEFGAAVALYSVIHLEPAELPTAFAEFRRVLRPGAPLLLAFHVGTEIRHLTEWWGHEVDVDFHFHQPEAVLAPLREAGFTVTATMQRAPAPQEAETQRCYVLAHRARD